MNDPLGGWYKRISKKAPYYLFYSEPFRNYCYDLPEAHKRWPHIENWERRWLIWQETAKGEVKTKLAIAEDGMSARYGFDTLAVLTGTSATGLWQASANLVTKEQLKALLDVANGKINMSKFDICSLKDIDW